MTDTPIRRISEDMNHTIKDAASRATESAQHITQKARHIAGDAADFAGDLKDEAVARGRKATTYAVREARDHPLASLAIAAGIGALVSALLIRRH